MEKLPFVNTPRATSVQFDRRSTFRKYKDLLEDGKLLNVDDSYIKNATNPAKDTDMKELSLKLKGIRTQYDRHRRSASGQEQVLSELKRSLDYYESVSSRIDNTRSEKYANKLERKIEKTVNQIEVEQNSMLGYKQLIHRMGKTLVALKEEFHKKQNSLSSQDYSLKVQKKKKEKVKVKKQKARRALFRLLQAIQTHKQVRVKDLHKISKDVKTLKHEKKKKKSTEQALKYSLENALIQEKSQESEHMRENLLLVKLLYAFESKKFEKEHANWQILESAFEKIKICTGVSEINLIVENFFSKERKFRELIQTVRNKENLIARFKNNILQIQKQINTFETESIELKENIEGKNVQQFARNIQINKEKTEKLRIKHEKIVIWLRRILQKIIANLPNKVALRHSDSLLGNILLIRDQIRGALKSYKNDKGSIKLSLENMRKMNLTDIIEEIPHSLRLIAQNDSS